PEAFDKGLARRGLSPMATKILGFDKEWRKFQALVEQARADRNAVAKRVGTLKAKGEDATGALKEAAEFKKEEENHENQAKKWHEQVEKELALLPNIPADDVPDGKDAADNKLLREVGAKPKLAFKPKDHAALGEALGGMDFARAAKMSGARFVVLSGGLARLARALGQFMLDLHTREFGYTEVVPPLLVRDATVFGTGQLPKFKYDVFQIPPEPNENFYVAVKDTLRRTLGPIVNVEAEANFIFAYFYSGREELAYVRLKKNFPDKADLVKSEISTFVTAASRQRLWLIPTAEVPLTNLAREEILDEEKLPLRYTALTPCFRSEAGAAGKDTRGMIRQHQFDKVELVSIAHPDKSSDEHERMTGCAEEVLKRLGLAYRVMLL
ncbi:MAG: serine--tRNA ligase, partial [Stellaceae bacterium]